MGTVASAQRAVADAPNIQGNATRASRLIDKELAKEKLSQLFKILLLGGSECGKTTIFKQMRILHLDGFSNEDKNSFRTSIILNVLDSIFQLLEACNRFRMTHERTVQEDIQRFMAFRATLRQRIEGGEDEEKMEVTVPIAVMKAIKSIWNSSNVANAYERRFEYQILESTKYFLDDISRICEPEYVPNTLDILHCRYRTTGINELSFEYKKMKFKMVDVGGQRTERRKWIHCFDNVDMVLFVLALSDFDQQDPEDVSQNRMLQNFEIFKTLVQSELFRHASVVLFLNKYDIFQEKLKTTQLNKCWRNYKGDNSVDDAVEFLQKQFRRCVHERQRFDSFDIDLLVVIIASSRRPPTRTTSTSCSAPPSRMLSKRT